MPTTAEDLALLDVDTVLTRAGERLTDRFARVFGPETIDRCVHESYVVPFRTAKVHRHLLAPAEHFAGDRLWPTPRAR
jgi:arsenate reductase (thioredoxin)